MPELNDSANIVTTLSDSDFIVVEVGSTVKRITKANLAALLSGGGGGSGAANIILASPLTNTSQVFTGTGAGFATDSAFGDKTLPVANMGSIYCQFKTDSPEIMFGFSESGTANSNNSIGAGFFFTSGGLFKIEAGGYAVLSPAYTYVNNKWIRVLRLTSSTWKLQDSTDETTWADIPGGAISWAPGGSTTILKPQGSIAPGGKIYFPKAIGLS